MKKNRVSIIFIFLVASLLLSYEALAIHGDKGIVPCGQGGDGGVTNKCQICHIPQLIKNIIEYVSFHLVPPVAALLFAAAGIILLTAGGNPKRMETAKDIFTKTVIGLLIVYTAWLIIASLLQLLLKKDGAIRPPWNELPACQSIPLASSVTTAPTTSTPSDSSTKPYVYKGECFVEGLDICNENTEELYREDTAISDKNAANVRTSTGDIKCSGFTGALNSYSDAIKNASEKYGVPPERIQSIILIESSGRSGAQSTDRDRVSNYGLMQVRVDTARFIDPELRNKSDAEVKNALLDPSKNIDVGARYYSFLSKLYSNSAGYATAAFNGGPKANLASQDCPGIKRWECPWDSPGCYQTDRTNCLINTGYQGTRDYVATSAKLSQAINSGTCKPISN